MSDLVDNVAAAFKLLNSTIAERDRYREALQKICDPDRCKWSAPEMFHIADAALKGATAGKDCEAT